MQRTPTIPVRTQASAPPRMSFDAFMKTYEGRFAEWVDGEVIEFMPASSTHQALLNFLNHLIDLYAKLFNLGTVQLAPYAMRATPGGSLRGPDLMFIATENITRRTEKYLAGPADLVVEIVSPESVHRDRDEKYHEYARGGIREYWVIDSRPNRHRADFHRLLPEGHYELFATEDDERVESAVLPGFWLNPAWLWEAGERDPLLTLMEIRGLSPAAAEQVRALLLGDSGTAGQEGVSG